MIRLCRPGMMTSRFTGSIDPLRARTKACRDLKDYKEERGKRVDWNSATKFCANKIT